MRRRVRAAAIAATIVMLGAAGIEAAGATSAPTATSAATPTAVAPAVTPTAASAVPSLCIGNLGVLPGLCLNL